MTDSPYVAKRVQAGIPLWDIMAHGSFIGVLSDLPMEDSPMATIRYMGHEETFAAYTIHDVLMRVGYQLREMDAVLEAQADEDQALSDAEYYSEVIGPMEAAERRAEWLGWGRDEDPVW